MNTQIFDQDTRAVTADEAAALLRTVPFPNLVFDVDETLYRRSEPYLRAYRLAFAARREREEGWPDEETLFRKSRRFTEEEYRRRMRGEINMEEMLVRRTVLSFAACGITVTREEALAFEEIYEKAQGEIRLVPAFRELFDTLAEVSPAPFLGVLTNGPSAHQRNKIRALGLTKWIPEENILVTGDIDTDKPHLGAFRAYEARCGVRPEETLMIGDNPEADIRGALAAGWHALWIKLN